MRPMQERAYQKRGEQYLATGYIYVLRSQSEHPFIVENRSVEWFFVPLNAIEEVIEKIQAGTIDRFRYDVDRRSNKL
jgi:hypothetical protein